MRISIRLLAVASAAFATAALAQPYGMHEWDNFWTAAGRFDTPLGTEDIYTGHYLGFFHLLSHVQDNGHDKDWKPMVTSDRAYVSAALVFDEEQLRKGHGAYWQAWASVSVDCLKHTYRVTDIRYYNKPRFKDGPADELWTEEAADKDSWDARYFQPPKPRSLGEAIVTRGCAAPLGTAPL